MLLSSNEKVSSNDNFYSKSVKIIPIYIYLIGSCPNQLFTGRLSGSVHLKWVVKRLMLTCMKISSHIQPINSFETKKRKLHNFLKKELFFESKVVLIRLICSLFLS